MQLYYSDVLNFEGIPVTRSHEPQAWRLQYFVVLENVQAGEIIQVCAKGQLRNNCFVNNAPLFVEGVVVPLCSAAVANGGAVDALDHSAFIERTGGENWSFRRHYLQWRIATLHKFAADMPLAIVQTYARCRSNESPGGQYVDALPGYGEIKVLRFNN